ncbi:MAG: insulinase family protein [Balneolaceae bacterium]|nr:insulinase family protein [Balneolaceae bacterium]
MKRLFSTLLLLPALLLVSCSTGEPTPELGINYEKFTLDNGLEVIFHTDRSDPVAAVALTFHVGSAREEAGRTGFAHLFEHLSSWSRRTWGAGDSTASPAV